MKHLISTLIVGVSLLMPFTVLANDAVMLGPSASVPTSSSGADDPSITPTAGGPSSPQSSSVLQPAGSGDGSSLQPGGSSSGLSAENAAQNALQQPASQDQAKLFIQGDADTGGSDTEKDSMLPVWLIVLIILLAIISGSGGIILWLRGKVAHRNNFENSGTKPPVHSEPVSEASAPAPATVKPVKAKKHKKRRRR